MSVIRPIVDIMIPTLPGDGYDEHRHGGRYIWPLALLGLTGAVIISVVGHRGRQEEAQLGHQQKAGITQVGNATHKPVVELVSTPTPPAIGLNP